MTDPPVVSLEPNGRYGDFAAVRVAVLTDPQGALGTAALLLEADGVHLMPAASLARLLAIVAAGEAQVAVVDPELGQAWPTEAAEQAVSELLARAPLIFICRVEHDAELIEQRVGGPAVRVLRHGGVSAVEIVTIARGLAAGSGGHPGTVP